MLILLLLLNYLAFIYTFQIHEIIFKSTIGISRRLMYSTQLPSIQLPIVFINLNYMAACFDQRTAIFRPVRDVIIKLHLHKHDVHLCTYKTNKIILLNGLQIRVYMFLRLFAK